MNIIAARFSGWLAVFLMAAMMSAPLHGAVPAGHEPAMSVHN